MSTKDPGQQAAKIMAENRQKYRDTQSNIRTCDDCLGTGRLRALIQNPNETTINTVTCQKCGGRGWIDTAVRAKMERQTAKRIASA